MRTFTVTRESDLEALRGTLIDRRISASRADAAMARLRALNPHVDFERLAPGTILFIPLGPEFTARAGDSPAATAADELRGLAETALGEAAVQLEGALAERAAERETVRAAFRDDDFRRAIVNDRDLQQRAEGAARAMEEEEREDSSAAERLDATGRAALEALSGLGRLAG